MQRVARAQSDTATLSGTIMDASGAVIPNAGVLVHNNATNADTKAASNASGSFTVPNLTPGDYNIRVSLSGFQTTTLNNVHVDPSIGRHVDITLNVGNTATRVTVQAGVNAIQTESASVGQLVTQEQVKNIQLNGRNPLYLSQLEPGVVRGNSMAAFAFGLDNNINVNGARNEESIITFDGAPMVRTRANGTSVGVADVDSTSQVQILTTGYQAEYGRTSGGQIRIVPKSGGSQFHGTAFEYFRNNVLNANTWSRNYSGLGRAAFRYNQFGWNFNGPFFIPGHFNKDRKKIFFLLGQEYVRYNHDDLATQKVPTDLMRSGNFSELLGPNIFYSKPLQIENPNTGAPYAGNIIPPDELSANGTGLLDAYPAANTNAPGYNWIDSALYTEAQRKDSIVVDYIPSDAHHLRFSLLNYNYNDFEPHYGNFNRTPRIFNRPNQVAVLHYAWTISPTMVNDVTVAAAADHVNIGIYTASGLYNRTNYGINYPYLYGADSKVLPDKIPTIEIANFGTLDGGPYPSRSGGIVYDVADNLTKVMGNHTLTAGAIYEYSGENNFDQINVSSTIPGSTNNQNGLFVFTDTRNGDTQTSDAAVANAALGLFDTYGEIGHRSYTLFRSNRIAGFAQDDWRASQHLVLQYGLRYTINTPFYAIWGNQSFFNPTYYNPANAPTVNPTTGFITGGTALNGVVIPGSGFPSVAKGHVPDAILANGYAANFHGLNRGYNPTVYTDLQPRLGFAYQLSPLAVFRGGAGRYVQRLGISDNVQVGGNAPFQPSSTVTNGSVDNPGGIGENATPLSFTSHSYNYPSPYAYSWNLTFEQEIPTFGTFTLAYVGRRGTHLEELANINQLAPGTIQANPTIKSPDALRPYLGYSTIIQSQNDGASIYHSLQANLKRRLSKGVLFGVAYTWSKSLDYGSSNAASLPNIYDRNIYYGPSDFDTRNVVVINYVWDIPYGTHSSNRLVRGALGNWQTSGTIQVQSGRPLNISQGNDYAGVGPGSGNQLWTRTGPSALPHGFAGGKSSNKWFDPTVFVRPAAGTFAPRGSRNYIYGPGFQSYSAALEKAFHVIPGHDSNSLIFRAEAFNYLNHPNLDNPDTSPTSGTFGDVNAKGNTYASERQFQFSLRYQF
jgi:hypothetical protein